MVCGRAWYNWRLPRRVLAAVGIGDSGYEDALLDKAVLTAYYGVVGLWFWRYCREGRWYAL